MKTRIGLVTTKAMGRSTTTFVEVADVKELGAELAKIGAKRVALFWRDRIGDGHGESCAASGLGLPTTLRQRPAQGRTAHMVATMSSGGF